ncbi:MAG: hypothetical protein IJT54_05095 [Candidatus Methanomethylophilaceae archaeon]|nr:hypothetical protein [Candidatus Methanomethylophilaceae archaeon]
MNPNEILSKKVYSVYVNGFSTPIRVYPTETDARIFVSQYSLQYPEDRLNVFEEVHS